MIGWLKHRTADGLMRCYAQAWRRDVNEARSGKPLESFLANQSAERNLKRALVFRDERNRLREIFIADCERLPEREPDPDQPKVFCADCSRRVHTSTLKTSEGKKLVCARCGSKRLTFHAA